MRGLKSAKSLELTGSRPAEPNVGLMALTVSTPVGGDLLLTLHGSHS